MLVLTVACSKDQRDEAPAAAEPAAEKIPKAQPAIALPGADDHGEGGSEVAARVGVKLPQSTVAAPGASGKARRITLEPPLPSSTCSSRNHRGVAVVGTYGYLIERGAGVRRYRIGDTWTLDATFGEGGLMVNPEVPPLKQKLGGGSFYGRSGGTSYQFARGPGDSLYIWDFLDGIHRVDGKDGFAACHHVPGLRGLAFDGERALVLHGKQLKQVEPGRECALVAPRDLPLEANALLPVGKDLYLAGVDDKRKHRVVRLAGGKKPVFTAGGDDAFADDGLCYAGRLFPRGDRMCVVDANCNKVSCFATKDGSLAATFKNQELFGGKVYKLEDVHPVADGRLYAAVTLRNWQDDQCEAAVFELPASDAKPVK